MVYEFILFVGMNGLLTHLLDCIDLRLVDKLIN